MTDPRIARQQLTDHPHYKYRGCAPDPDNPRRAAADPDVSLEAWLPYTGEGAEPQRERIARERAAVTICDWCPVKALCAAYANTETPDGHLVEAEGIWGGETSLTRHRAHVARHAATVRQSVQTPERARTPQKTAVLLALAAETDTELVAYRAGMDVRTANWHRSGLVTLLGMDKDTTTRRQLLAAAVRHSLLPATIPITPDGPVAVAAAPTTDGVRQRRIERLHQTVPQLPLSNLTVLEPAA